MEGTMAAKRFTAVLERLQDGLGWTIARVPFEPAEVWEQMVRLRVRGSVNGFAFRTSLFPTANAEVAKDAKERKGYFLLVTKEMQRVGGVSVGEMAEFRLEPDLEPRPAELPDELAALLDAEAGLREYYDALSEYTRREIGKWVLGVKSEEAKMRRAEQMAERLLATMEAEKELPPQVQAAFRMRPKAKVGWGKMTPTQRRMELFAVTYYQTPEGREKRVGKLCAEAEKRA